MAGPLGDGTPEHRVLLIFDADSVSAIDARLAARHRGRRPGALSTVSLESLERPPRRAQRSLRSSTTESIVRLAKSCSPRRSSTPTTTSAPTCSASSLTDRPLANIVGSVRAWRETPDSGRTVWTDVYPYGYGERPPAAEIYVHMRARPLIAVTTSELRRPEDGGARPHRRGAEARGRARDAVPGGDRARRRDPRDRAAAPARRDRRAARPRRRRVPARRPRRSAERLRRRRAPRPWPDRAAGRRAQLRLSAPQIVASSRSSASAGACNY